ncbi:MAG: mandelate racemase/muconate lactonizing enzyme family protein, partial [Acidobacteriota bacterium]|nr:mandelate racemase/muconate lactonizing enzyme family protein [Acidobacteriota bacterium]
WDRAGIRAGRPVAALLVDDPASEVTLNATITASDRAGAAAQAAEALAAGYRCVKVKVAIGDDAGRLAAVRAAGGPALALRIDANRRWSVPEAIAAINALAPAGLELVEEPVAGIAATRRVRDSVSARIAIDETAAEPGALTAGVADAICLKVSRCGGISALLAAAALVRASGAEVYLASTLDGPLGIAAAVHAAAALAARGPIAPCGLGTLALFDGDASDPARAPVVSGGAIGVPHGPGLLTPMP